MAYSMLSQHKDALRVHRVALVQQLVVDQVLLSQLQATRTLTESMREEVEGGRTNTIRASQLLDLLPRRGPNAMTNFIEALVMTSQDYLADPLDSHLANRMRAKHPNRSVYTSQQPIGGGGGVGVQPTPLYGVQPSPEAYAPFKYPPPDPPSVQESKVMKGEAFIPINLKEVKESEIMHLLSDKDNVYNMSHNPRGYAIIINNEHFLNKMHADRDGSAIDVTNIDQLLNGLHFKTHVYPNLTADRIKKVLDEHSQRKELANADAFILVIMSHGARGSVFGTDGHKVTILDDIVKVFEGKSCPALINKPKAFIIQACQGADYSIGVAPQADGPTDMSASDAVEFESLTQNIEDLKLGDTSESVPQIAHERSDSVLAYSTVPGYKSWRHPELGSWFIRILVETICEQAHKEHLTDMLTVVARKIKDMETSGDKKYKQISETRSTFTKKLYFFPGYHLKHST